jgi:hypothetical protein
MPWIPSLPTGYCGDVRGRAALGSNPRQGTVQVQAETSPPFPIASCAVPQETEKANQLRGGDISQYSTVILYYPQTILADLTWVPRRWDGSAPLFKATRPQRVQQDAKECTCDSGFGRLLDTRTCGAPVYSNYIVDCDNMLGSGIIAAEHILPLVCLLADVFSRAILS